MRKIVLYSSLLIVAIIGLFLVLKKLNYHNITSTLPPRFCDFCFSEEANQLFFALLPANINLNSGITMERADPAYLDQINNVTFAVFNHTDEAIIFTDQGFGLTVFRYDENNKVWERLQLNHTPFAETLILPPKTENWGSDYHNFWDILENDILALGSEQVRLYVWGIGKVSSTEYGAYLDITISTTP